MRSSWIGCTQGSSYTLHRQSRRHEKGAVSQPLLRRCFRRLLLIFVPPIHPLTIPTVGYLSLGSPQCIVCPKMCRENRGIVQHRGTGSIIEHSLNDGAVLTMDYRNALKLGGFVLEIFHTISNYACVCVSANSCGPVFLLLHDF